VGENNQSHLNLAAEGQRVSQLLLGDIYGEVLKKNSRGAVILCEISRG